LLVRTKFSALKLSETDVETDFMTGQEISDRGGYAVRVKDALELLGKNSPEAAYWFNDNLPSNLPFLTFGPDEVELLPGSLEPLIRIIQS